ncbi:MAG: hypothetical protein N2D54_01065 [Chloroflexota bacterium]
MSFGELVHNFFVTPGPGGVVVVTVIIFATTFYIYLTRWIIQGGKGNKRVIDKR